MTGLLPLPRVATLTRIGNPEIDRGLVLWFPGPQSFTGEDCAEFQIHGGRAVVAALLAALGRLDNCRMAEAGEFSRRAFLNGKFDLTQAEGLADLIDSETEEQRKQALRQLDGALGVLARRWKDALLHAQALIEADIDFSDEGDVGANHRQIITDSVTKLLVELDDALTGYQRSQQIRQGIYVVIAGAPNVGKSSLLNALAKREVAIVTSVAGTTRDVVEVNLNIDGYLFILVDTAGIRETNDVVEKIGVSKARQAIRAADLVLWLSDGIDLTVAETVDCPVFKVQTKLDLRPLQSARFDFGISVTMAGGLDELQSRLSDFLQSRDQFSGLVTRERHFEALGCMRGILAGILLRAESAQDEILAEELRAAAFELGRLVGQYGVEDVLGQLFSTFCIGK